MSRIYDNWERLVAAVIRREELWQLCHDHSRSPSISSISSDFSYSSFEENSTSGVLWDEYDYEPGEKKAVQELKELFQEANPSEEIYIWGVKLLEDQKTDTVLLKFLRAQDFDVKNAFNMMKNTIQWRKEFGIDQLLEEDLGNEMDKLIFNSGYSKEGHPVCYTVYGELQEEQLYQNLFSDEEKRQRFLKWKIQFVEKTLRKLDFNPGGISTIVQVNDVINLSGTNKRELLQANKLSIQLLQDNYPEYVAKHIFINAPWWHLALNKMISPLLTQRTKSKFVSAGPSRSIDTLYKYIYPEQIPVKFGGLSKEYGDFGVADSVTEVIVKPSSTQTVEFHVTQGCIVAWEARVVRWEVIYGVEFVPSAEDDYTVILHKMRRIGSNQEQLISSSSRVGGAGKVVLTIRNVTSKKKKLLYRFKIKLFDD